MAESEKKRRNINKDTEDKLTQVYIENDMNGAKTGEELGITRQAVHAHLQKPSVKEMIQNQLEQDMTAAGISKSKVLKRLDEQLDATKAAWGKKDKREADHHARDKAIDKCLKLYRVLEPEDGKGNITAIQINFHNADKFMTKEEQEAIVRSNNKPE